ncbi:hypothetical protein QFX18_11560 [Saccharophagus degradans]|uniref:hypothetical protein n=1 Tax=Saccharophagus degradans TaxID=86304 RepID=UPI002477EFBB|nr:hypothetical protein [Saccharophagus degradans]WGO96683.1 hypothetical protein QFX18_11560 [Saccharophagus degradans]
MKSKIVYLQGEDDPKYVGRICRVTVSKTGKTLSYNSLELQKIKGYKTNHLEINSGYEYWISNPKKSGEDTLYPGMVRIDEDVREEYWVNVRNLPESKTQTSYRCLGKYSRRSPHAELNVTGNSRNGGDRAQQR